MSLVERMRQRSSALKSQAASTLRSAHEAWLPKSKDYLPTFQIIGLIVTALALWATWQNLKHTKRNAARQSCREARTALDEISAVISPAFPQLLCKTPVIEEPLPWPRIEDLLLRADTMIGDCDVGDIPEADQLHARLLIIKSLEARADSTRSNGWDDYQKYKSKAAEALGPTNPLVVLRRLEDRVLRLEDLAYNVEDPCGPEWEQANNAADTILGDPAWQHYTDSASLRGCLWQLRGEQAYYRAGRCGEDEVARLLQAITSFRSAAELAQKEETLYPAIGEVLRTATGKSELGEAKEIALATSWLNTDAQRWSTKKVDKDNLTRERTRLLSKRPRKYMEMRDLFAGAVQKGRRTDGYLEELYLADVLIFAGGRQAVPDLLTGAVQEGDGHNSDFRYHVLVAKALCFEGKFKESLRPLDLAVALETDDLAERWGSAQILRPMCALAACQGSLDGLHSLFKDSRDKIDPEVCTVREVAPALVKALRERGAGSWLDQFDEAACKNWSGL